MKTIKKVSIVVFFIVVLTSFFACQTSSDGDSENADSIENETNETIDSVKTDIDTEKIHQSETVKDDSDYTAKYVCPMHCEGSGSDKQGTCPKCEMDLIDNPDYEEN